MDYDQALEWLNLRIRERTLFELAGLREYVAALRSIRDLLYAGQANAQVVEQIAPLCPCLLDEQAGPDEQPRIGPLQECPIHGDGQLFVALCRWRDAVVGTAMSFRELHPDLGQHFDSDVPTTWDRLCELLDGGPWAEPAPQDAQAHDARSEPF